VPPFEPTTRYDFTDRVALVTGGGSGIGRACGARLRAGGAAIAILDRDPGAAEAAAAELEGLPLVADVARSAEVEAAVERVESELGRLDVLVCSAGVGGDSLHTEEVSDEEWGRVFAVNCHGVFYANRAVIAGMKRRGYGRIVNIASIAGKEGNPMAAAYSASKAAVIGLTKSIGKDLVGTGILVSSVAPAVVETPILAQMSQEHVDYMVSRIPLGRLGQPEEVAALVAFLSSEEMTFSTGACFDISGGRATY
jgi:NAD(P)-dependent dehydrogenase (short-subunit alcohol dehydrogenase family)